MRDRKKRNMMIAALSCLLVFMGVGYALLTQILTIDGTATLTGEWRIEITNITTTETEGTATNATGSPSFTPDRATFSVNLVKPGDRIVYEVTVKNFGTIDAVLSLNADLALGSKDVKFSNTLESGTILKGGEETTFEVEAEFSEFATSVQTGAISKYTIVMVYTQYDGNSLYDPTNTTTDNGVFKVENGAITDYNAELGTHVSIPAEIDGVAITSISSDAFKEEKEAVYNYDLKVALTTAGTPEHAVIFNEDVKDELLALTGGGIPIYSVGDSDIPALGDGSYYGYYNYSEDLLSTPPILESDSGFLGESSAGKVLAIKSLDLSNATNLQSIDDYAFANYDVDAALNSVEGSDVSLDEGLTSLTFGNNISEIELGLGVFAGANLNTLRVPSNLKSVGDMSIFSEDDNYSNIKAAPFNSATINTLIIDAAEASGVMPGRENMYSPDLYGYIDNIDKLVFSDGIVEIGGSLFYKSIVDSIEFGSTVSTVGEATFMDGGLTELILPKNLVTIGDRAFQNNSITSVVIPDKVTTVGSYAFNSNGMTEVTFGKSVKTIGGMSFQDNNLTSVVIPASVVEIGNHAFLSNPSLKSIVINRSQEGMTFGDNWHPSTVTPEFTG